MAKSTNRWIREAWKREENKEENAIVSESISTMEEVGVRLRFADNSIRLDEEVLDKATEYKAVWRKVKNSLQEATESRRIEIYKTKEQQSQVYSGAELTWSKDIINHDDAGTDGGDKIMEGVKRIGPR